MFGLYIDKIEAMLQAAKDSIDVPRLLGEIIVAILLFADDIALFSYSPQGLQAQLNILQQFCHDRGLKVNVAKTKVVVFEHRQSISPAFLYEGQVIEQVQVFKYLGIAFHANRGLSCAIEHLCNTARKAMFGVLGHCHQLHLQDPRVKCMLFDAAVRPMLTHACEVWAIVGGKTAMQQMERVQLGFLRQLLGVPVNCSSKLIHAEFGRLPLRHMWLKQSLAYLQRMKNLEGSRLCKVAFEADVQLGLGWYHGLQDQLRSHGVRLPRIGQECNIRRVTSDLPDYLS